MRFALILAVTVVTLSAASCKGKDKCGTCPTFSKIEKFEQKSI